MYCVTSTAYADSYLPICRAIGARVRFLVSRVDPFAHHHLNRVLRPTGQLSVIEVDIRNRYYYSTTQNRNTGNLHRPPGGLKTLLEYRYVTPPLFVHTTIATLRAQHSSARCTLAAVVWAEYYQRRA